MPPGGRSRERAVAGWSQGHPPCLDHHRAPGLLEAPSSLRSRRSPVRSVPGITGISARAEHGGPPARCGGDARAPGSVRPALVGPRRSLARIRGRLPGSGSANTAPFSAATSESSSTRRARLSYFSITWSVVRGLRQSPRPIDSWPSKRRPSSSTTATSGSVWSSCPGGVRHDHAGHGRAYLRVVDAPVLELLQPRPAGHQGDPDAVGQAHLRREPRSRTDVAEGLHVGLAASYLHRRHVGRGKAVFGAHTSTTSSALCSPRQAA